MNPSASLVCDLSQLFRLGVDFGLSITIIYLFITPLNTGETMVMVKPNHIPIVNITLYTNYYYTK